MKLAKALFITYFAATVLFLVCAWQADILNANLVFPVRNEPFFYWWWSWTKWTHYAWTFWGMAAAFFLPLVVLSAYAIEKIRTADTGGGSLKFDLDPTPTRAIVICISIFILTLTTGIAAITVNGEMPTDPQIVTILCGAFGAAVTYILGFVGYKEKTEAT